VSDGSYIAEIPKTATGYGPSAPFNTEVSQPNGMTVDSTGIHPWITNSLSRIFSS
jgi:hypothetical protein